MKFDLKKNKAITVGAVVGILGVIGAVIGIIADSAQAKYYINKQKEEVQSQTQVATAKETSRPTETTRSSETTTTTVTTTTTTTKQTEPPEPQPVPLMNPYDGSNYYVNQNVIMGGNTYPNSIKIRPPYWDTNTYMLFNLNEQYSHLEFDIGHVDGSDKKDSTYIISLDNKEEQSINVKADELPIHISIELNYCKQLRIECIEGNGYYAITNATLYP